MTIYKCTIFIAISAMASWPMVAQPAPIAAAAAPDDSCAASATKIQNDVNAVTEKYKGLLAAEQQTITTRGQAIKDGESFARPDRRYHWV